MTIVDGCEILELLGQPLPPLTRKFICKWDDRMTVADHFLKQMGHPVSRVRIIPEGAPKESEAGSIRWDRAILEVIGIGIG